MQTQSAQKDRAAARSQQQQRDLQEQLDEARAEHERVECRLEEERSALRCGVFVWRQS